MKLSDAPGGEVFSVGSLLPEAGFFSDIDMTWIYLRDSIANSDDSKRSDAFLERKFAETLLLCGEREPINQAPGLIHRFALAESEVSRHPPVVFLNETPVLRRSFGFDRILPDIFNHSNKIGLSVRKHFPSISTPNRMA